MAGKTPEEKAAFARQQLAGSRAAGNVPTAATASFAQQMQDPAFLAKFQAMSTTEQQAYLQQAGVMPAAQSSPAASTAAGSSNKTTAYKAMQAELTNRLQTDPVFAARYQKMSAAEQKAVIKDIAQEKGVSSSEFDARVAAHSGATPAANTDRLAMQKLIDLQQLAMEITTKLGNVPTAETAMKKPKSTYFDSLTLRHTQIEKALAQQLASSTTKDAAAATAFENAARQQALDKHLAQATQDLAKAKTTFAQKLADYQATIQPFCDGLIAIDYGNGSNSAAAAEKLRNLATYQSTMLTYMQSLNAFSQQMAEYGAEWEQKRLNGR